MLFGALRNNVKQTVRRISAGHIGRISDTKFGDMKVSDAKRLKALREETTSSSDCGL